MVSVIIPCYNNEEWIAAAIDSALSQTYTPIEVIVIDDGSTDKSLEIIKSYGDRLKWETGVNRGQSAARNRGFKLSSGKYIQWLDADDYIFPDKIMHQVQYLETVDCDIVYGDWIYQTHDQLKIDEISLSDINITGKSQDILRDLLEGLALTVMNCLTKREVVESVNGFDEDLRACEDVLFWIKAAILRVKFGYQPGCYSVYRRHKNDTVSTISIKALCDSADIAFMKAYELLLKSDMFEKYRKGLASLYFTLGKLYLYVDFNSASKCMKKVDFFCPNYKPNRNSVYEKSFIYFGFKITSGLFILTNNFKKMYVIVQPRKSKTRH